MIPVLVFLLFPAVMCYMNSSGSGIITSRWYYELFIIDLFICLWWNSWFRLDNVQYSHLTVNAKLVSNAGMSDDHTQESLKFANDNIVND